ncbi:hypothetical protein P4O66_021672 [Electrophorus voltai]|uniref:Uncharacterized protein n=1 Tax=Electrophorus voltai TaxID=2609070 RepID=A0AAD9E5P9_9TELE|nr:hypothetical protein P4O66_021672 [Electrophorus voltai]
MIKQEEKLKEDEEEEKEEEIRTVLTKGIAGIGKTISVQKFILDWARRKANQDIDLMIVMPFRELNLVKVGVLRKMLEQNNIGTIPQTLTEMYINFLLLQTNVRNQKYDENEEVDTNQLLQLNKDILLKLAKLAFIQLMKGNLIYYKEDLQECGVDVTNDLENSGVCTEVLQKESVIYQRKVYCFVHMSFQEFLAAFYIFRGVEWVWR